MALLSIAEPGQSKPNVLERRKYAVGIDLGTTNSLVAIAKEGQAKTLDDSKERSLLPSVVHYGEQGLVSVGYEALAKAESDPANTVSSVKRLMGRGLDDVSYELPYKLISSESGGMPLIETNAGALSPVQISADILKELANRSLDFLATESDSSAEDENNLKPELEGVVITVPAYFDEAQRQATKDAARIAGLNVLRLLGEPTAAAVAYGLDTKLEGTVVIYDLGGGTFDVSLMKLQKGVFEVLATGGDTALGGDDFDRAIIGWIVREANVETPLSAAQLNNISSIARQAKHALSLNDKVKIEFEQWQGELDRESFNALVDPLIDSTLKACRRVLRDAETAIDEITDVVMVGGSTYSPRVREKVSDFFQRELLTELDPEKVVALGAALQADVLVGNKYGDEMLLLDVIPLSLGIETMGGLMEKIIPRNTTIPVARAQEFTTFKDGQSIMSLHVLQGERELVSDARSLARFQLKEIPPMVAGAARIRVTFQVDADGLMEVQAKELSTGKESSVVIKPSFGLEDKEVEQMIISSFTAASEDKQMRALREREVEALRMIEAIRAALDEDGAALLSKEEHEELEKGIAELESSLETEDADLIEEKSVVLNDLSVEFASRRMDTQIRTALKGQNVQSLDN